MIHLLYLSYLFSNKGTPTKTPTEMKTPAQDDVTAKWCPQRSSMAASVPKDADMFICNPYAGINAFASCAEILHLVFEPKSHFALIKTMSCRSSCCESRRQIGQGYVKIRGMWRIRCWATLQDLDRIERI